MRLRGRYGGKIFASVVFAVSVVTAALGFEATPAAAQDYIPWFNDDQPRTEPARNWKRRPRSPSRTALNDYGRLGLKAAGEQSAREAKPTEVPNPQRPLFVVASIADQRVSVYNHDGLVASSAISTGMAGHPTPKGIFTIIGRERFHRSNIYSAAPMPFMQRVTWSGIAMHLGVVPGHPASHGCIRLPAEFATKLWGLTKIGERIVISQEEVTPTEFAHPLLPAPKMLVQAEADRAAPAVDAPRAPIAAAGPPLVNPRQYAEQLKVKATAEVAAAVKTVKEMFTALGGKRQEAARARAEFKVAETDHASAHSKADAAAKTFEAAAAAASTAQRESVLAAEGLKSAESTAFDKAMADHFAQAYEKAAAARDAATTVKKNADSALADALTKLETAKTASEAKDAELADAVRRLNEATAASDGAANDRKEALRRAMPVSVLVSKKDRRIYVRQGLAPVFDAPISVRDPETLLGSHLYIATAANEDGTALKWSVVSMPDRAAEDQGERRTNKGWVDEQAGMPPTPRRSTSTPAEALERVEIAQDVRDRIGERLWTGGSLIITDQPLSGETGNDGTDLTVKVR
jgi:lipoprotein-anchoring transpeptidase ErfK/SrfK